VHTHARAHHHSSSSNEDAVTMCLPCH
jgi:hypothetical protein